MVPFLGMSVIISGMKSDTPRGVICKCLKSLTHSYTPTSTSPAAQMELHTLTHAWPRPEPQDDCELFMSEVRDLLEIHVCAKLE